MEVCVFSIEEGDSPLVASAIHDGGAISSEIQPWLAISAADRLREQDPHTGGWTVIAPTRVVGQHSRFEVDLNRPRDKAVYRAPMDSWGLQVWKTELPAEVVEASLARYDAFYEAVEELLTRLVDRFGRLVVYDLHTYNRRRGGPTAAPDDPALNPDVNVGTGTMDRQRWAAIVERFLGDLRGFDFFGRQLDIRENVKFFGGHFPKWIHHRFPTSVCVLSIEWKKFFMDEWTGQVDSDQCDAIRRALASTVPGVLKELRRL